MNIQDTINALQEILTEYLIDPISKRTSKWIYDEDGRIELDKSPYPKILLRAESSPSEKPLNAIGSYDTLNIDIIEVHIKAKVGSHYGIGDQKYTGKEFVSEIARQITEILKKSEVQTKFDEKGFYSVLPYGDDFQFDKENNPTIVYRIRARYIDKS